MSSSSKLEKNVMNWKIKFEMVYQSLEGSYSGPTEIFLFESVTFCVNHSGHCRIPSLARKTCFRQSM